MVLWTPHPFKSRAKATRRFNANRLTLIAEKSPKSRSIENELIIYPHSKSLFARLELGLQEIVRSRAGGEASPYATPTIGRRRWLPIFKRPYFY